MVSSIGRARGCRGAPGRASRICTFWPILRTAGSSSSGFSAREGVVERDLARQQAAAEAGRASPRCCERDVAGASGRAARETPTGRRGWRSSDVVSVSKATIAGSRAWRSRRSRRSSVADASRRRRASKAAATTVRRAAAPRAGDGVARPRGCGGVEPSSAARSAAGCAGRRTGRRAVPARRHRDRRRRRAAGAGSGSIARRRSVVVELGDAPRDACELHRLEEGDELSGSGSRTAQVVERHRQRGRRRSSVTSLLREPDLVGVS